MFTLSLWQKISAWVTLCQLANKYKAWSEPRQRFQSSQKLALSLSKCSTAWLT